MEKLMSSRNLVYPISVRCFACFESSELSVDAEIWCDQVYCFDRASPVRHCNHVLRIQAMTRCPFAPRFFNAFGGVDEHTIEVEQDRAAA